MTLTKEPVELKEREARVSTEERIEPLRPKERAEPRPTKPAPTQNRSFLGLILGVVTLLVATIVIVAVATRGGNATPEPSTEPDLPTIAPEDWELPEVSIPDQVRVPAEAWILPEANVAEAREAAALAHLAYELPEANVAEGEALAWAENYELPEMSVAEGEALAWAENDELPEMSVAEGEAPARADN